MLMTALWMLHPVLLQQCLATVQRFAHASICASPCSAAAQLGVHCFEQSISSPNPAAALPMCLAVIWLLLL
jgi:hypothetical protein